MNTIVTPEEKLEQVRVRISDLGSFVAEVAQANNPLATTLYRRLMAIREIVFDEEQVCQAVASAFGI